MKYSLYRNIEHIDDIQIDTFVSIVIKRNLFHI